MGNWESRDSLASSEVGAKLNAEGREGEGERRLIENGERMRRDVQTRKELWWPGRSGYWAIGCLGASSLFLRSLFWSFFLTHNMIGAEFHIATNVGSLSFGEKSIGDVARRVNCAIIRCC